MKLPFNDSNYDYDTAREDPRFRVLYVYARLSSDTEPEDVYPDDWEAAGVYEVLVPADLIDSLAANCALAGYNSSIPIKRLWMFEFVVRDPETGWEIDPDYSRDYYELADQCGGVKLLGHLG